MSDILDLNGQPFNVMANNAYEGAGVGFDNELARWAAHNRSADSAILPDLDQGNARAADLVRNDGYAKNGVQLHVDSIVGHQFKLVYKPNYRLLGLTPEQSRALSEQIESAWSNYAEDDRCYIDAERKRTFTMLIREAVATHTKTGEISAKAEWFKKRGSEYYTSIKLIDFARIGNPNGKMNTPNLKAGVKIDRHGAMVGVHIRKTHPNDNLFSSKGDNYKWIYVPRETPWGRTQFIHLFEPEGADQTRGANNFFASLSKLKMLQKFQAITLQNAIVNAMYAATIESEMNSDEVFRALGGGEKENATLMNYLNTKATFHENSNINVNGVKLPHLLPNEKLNMQSVNVDGTSLNDFEANILRHISSGLNVSYEELSKDFSKTNYSSARASMMTSARYFTGQREIIAKRFANQIFTLWFEEAVNLGKIVLPAGTPSFYEAKTAWTRANWIGAGKIQIDGLKAVKESVEKLNAGLTTYEAELADQGKDYIEVFDQQQREQAELEARGMTPVWVQKPEVEDKTATNENPEVHGNE